MGRASPEPTPNLCVLHAQLAQHTYDIVPYEVDWLAARCADAEDALQEDWLKLCRRASVSIHALVLILLVFGLDFFGHIARPCSRVSRSPPRPPCLHARPSGMSHRLRTTCQASRSWLRRPLDIRCGSTISRRSRNGSSGSSTGSSTVHRRFPCCTLVCAPMGAHRRPHGAALAYAPPRQPPPHITRIDTDTPPQPLQPARGLSLIARAVPASKHSV